ncbi:MAG: zinc ribbon domain-containing protein [bacterium]
MAKCRDCKHAILPASKSCPTCGSRYPNLSRKKYLRFEILKSVSIVLFALMLFAAAALLKELI